MKKTIIKMPSEEGNVSSQSSSGDTKRKVSIITEPVVERLGHDNLGFEQNKRKISQQSHHSEEGPARRKSNLHNNNFDTSSIHSDRYNGEAGGRAKKQSFSEALEKIERDYDNSRLEQSWIYSLCMRCRVEYTTPSWEPPGWQKVCPYPLCPSYRQFARILSIILIGVLLWITAFVIIGDTAAPGGQLFQLVVLTVAANFGGFLISLTTLPRLIGMLMVGILFQNVGWVNLDGEFQIVTAELRKLALVIILIRAGLEMDPTAFKKIYKTILKLGLIPWFVECSLIAVCARFFLQLPWMWSILLGSIVGAVSPAVVVPCLFRLRTKGYGVVKGIPTLIIAVAGIDDAVSVAGFGIISSIMFSTQSLGLQIAQAPVCIIGGLGFGVVWGFLCKYVPEPGDAYVVPIRTLMLFGGGLLAVFGSEEIHFEGAGPLGVVFAAFTASYFWCGQGWELEDNPVSTAFEIFWMIFEPILFGITGASIKIAELDPHIVSIGVGSIYAVAVIRILTTVAIAFGDKLNVKEKIFVAISWMSKATVQAALGPVALKTVMSNENRTEEEVHYAELVKMVCILSIILTAPLGAILISVTGTKLLKKTKQQLEPLDGTLGWRRSHRPSLHDISIIDEEEEREDIEGIADEDTAANTLSNAQTATAFTITK
ncbi:sodium/hydrogen exchanger 9B2 isoform X1 [Anopheles arabiensis]|nr:sodium/hydrogen exchanger 9B2 isoform X1 [Anopheles arabiensis]XP_040219504.1 sodium/hydrogen exchanger 9B2 isoform X1 [Anopheles coluzzii]XP_041765151.1 sodium/hydrogen exchanger 9B2 isoform X1 [Anopheles merus]XP_061496802.1 sodium/hydrogen exchanger 9B2 isoform X1 [Anopheles gambiae]